MTQQAAIGIVAILGALVLVANAARVRGRGGQPIGRYALIWAAFFAAAFAIAIALGR